MYIERKSEMDQEVNEATAALKGLLGIGSSGSDFTITKPEERSEEAPEIVSPEQNKTKKKRNKKNKKKQDETGKTSPKPPKPQQQSQNEANGQKSKNNINSSKKKGSKNKNKNAENFAWSAFQSSPDASKLPIPAFSSPVQSRKTIATENTDSQSNKNSKSEPSVTAETNSTQPPATPVGSAADSTPTKGEESITGVNLAVLASNPPPVTPNDAVVHPSLGSPPAQLFGSPPAYHASPHPPFSPMQYSYLPPPPPGHVTIQVQVPPVLMPGRQMVVTSPAGYPVQIVVPEGYQAGMIIPVFVPAAPPLPHMMPTGMPYAGGYYNAG
ncbi:hypothetical protein FisN_30Hh050 [Fistulifera solaris]|uniref:Uncharacterized protein n=1 Tax=Fistulifera solaris TaxID=1519565 RepID=A0A1Z5K6J8_FISSO|nr:hypothetical protein FisN_30Hh050 [Fistulifera solaris]|eukprot:GAX21849.1 hypothetical protein FisN_30Hh050 [Fistulifera solaris]